MNHFGVEPTVSAEHILHGLNPEQRKAATTTDGPVMIIAGPGSGKTRVLTTRMAYMIGTGEADPAGILALTFTNKAAREMKERVAGLVQNERMEPRWLGTFHSVMARVLRSHADKLGYTRSYSIYDTSDSERLIRDLMVSRRMDPKKMKPRSVQRLISEAKNKMLKPSEVTKEGKTGTATAAAELYLPYEQALKKANAFDFDDLLLKPIILFQRFPDILARYQDQWTHVHIDEYQDTNHVQYRLARTIASRRRNICVVGDDAQSIYAFRGADIGNILSFKSDYPDAVVVRLEQNYRSTKAILRLASVSIANNRKQLKKQLWTDNSEGPKVQNIWALTEQDEADHVRRIIREMRIRKGYSFDDFAVLYRTNAQSRALEAAMVRNDVPYQIIGGVSFYQKREVKDALAYLRVLVNPSDDVSLRRIINLPTRGIGKKTINDLTTFAGRHQISLWEVIADFQRIGLGVRAVRAVGAFKDLIDSCSALQEPPQVVARRIFKDSLLLQHLRKDDTVEGQNRLENVEELLNAVAEYGLGVGSAGSLAGFLQEVALFTDADASDGGNGKVTLMTIHASKGSEYPVVFITGLEEDLFPVLSADESAESMEEERRLFYVGVTRAKAQLFLLHASSRMRFGMQETRQYSRFLEEVEHEVEAIVYRPTATVRSARSFARQGRNVAQPQRGSTGLSIKIEPGSRVQHRDFGSGTVLSVTGSGDRRRAEVYFDHVGPKTLMLRLAPLRVADL